MASFPLGVSPASLACAFDTGFNLSAPQAIADWRAHAVAAFPAEAVGVITADGAFTPLHNVSPKPTTTFEMDPVEYEAAGHVLGVLHSHTPETSEDGQREFVTEEPSKSDMENQITSGVPWGISVSDGEDASSPVWWGDTLPIAPLLGRVFRHGTADCYTLIRDYHRLKGILFPDYPRDQEWWKKGGRMYEELFEDAGFRRVDRSQPIEGDVFLCSVRSPAAFNHGGIYDGNGMILHHLNMELSMRADANLWRSKLRFLIRHKDLPEKTS